MIHRKCFSHEMDNKRNEFIKNFLFAYPDLFPKPSASVCSEVN
jgi:hypothetical protein